MDYCALSLLATLGDDLKRVNKEAILKGVRSFQQKDGSYCPVAGGSENDMRFVYCASAICYMLNDWSGMDVDLTVKFICASQVWQHSFFFSALIAAFLQRYDGGISQGGSRESHGGSTYCAVASLYLMGKLESCELDREALIDWLSRRQTTGFQGRINKVQKRNKQTNKETKKQTKRTFSPFFVTKVPDSCYGFWVGASLSLLGVFDKVVNPDNLASFIKVCAGDMGGFAKAEDANSDVLHTYYSLCALSLCKADPALAEVSPHLGIPKRAAEIYESRKK